MNGRGGSGGAGSGAGSGGNPLGGLMDLLTRSGLAEQKDSWVGTGENQSVTGARALPGQHGGRLGRRAPGTGPPRAD
ncbi:YidB family protein [Streptomyces phaeochromogenes]